MPRNNLTKDEIRCQVLKIKNQLDQENINFTSDPKGLVHKYLDLVLSKIEEYRN